MTRRRYAWYLVPLLIIAFLAGAELSARLDDLIRYGVPLLAAPYVGYDLVVRDSATIRGRPYGRYERIQLNAAGFRGPPISPVPPPGCVRVIVLGASESIVGGEDVGTEYPARMQEELARHGCFEVQNAAVSGLDLCRMTTLWTNWAAKWSAQVVVVYPTPYFYVSPDAPEYPTEPLRPAGKPPWWTPRLAQRWHDQSFAPDVVAKWQIRRDIARKLAAHPRRWEYRAVPPDRLALYERHLDSLVVAIQATGAEPVLLTHANRFPNPPTEEDQLLMLAWEHNSRATAQVLIDFEHAANAAMAAVGRRRGAMIVDGAARMNGRRDWFSDFSHFSVEGRAVLGALLADSVRSLVGRRIATGFGGSRNH
jgi:hypothetical protein